METEVISIITLCDTHWHADGILCTHALSPLIQRKQTPFSSFHGRPEHTILMTNDLAQSRSRWRDRSAAIRANLEPLRDTPPR